MANNFGTVTFKLPDGTAVLPTWDYIISEISPYITRMTTAIQAENVDLGGISSRIDYWLEQQQPDEQEPL